MKKYFRYIFFLKILLLSSLKSTANICPCLGNCYIAGSGSIAWHNNQQFSFKTSRKEFFFSREYKRDWGGNFSIGYAIKGLECVDIRVESEFLYRSHNLHKGHVKIYKANNVRSKTLNLRGHAKDAAIMANLIADLPFPCTSCLNLYVGLGVGASYNRLTMRPSNELEVKPPYSRNSWLVAGQFLGGISCKCAKCIVLTLGYRLFSTGEVLTGRNLLRSDNRPYIQSVDLGLRLLF